MGETAEMTQNKLKKLIFFVVSIQRRQKSVVLLKERNDSIKDSDNINNGNINDIDKDNISDNDRNINITVT